MCGVWYFSFIVAVTGKHYHILAILYRVHMA